MHLVATPGTVIAVFKVLNNTSLTKGMEALCYCSWLDEIAFTDVAGDMRIEIFHQMLPLSSHSWGRKCWQSAWGQRSKSERGRCPQFTGAVALLCATGLLQAFDLNSAGLTETWLITPAPAPGESFSYQNLYSRFFLTILLQFLFSIHRFLLIPKFIFYLEFRSVPCVCEISRNMQRKEKETMKKTDPLNMKPC